MIPRQPSRKRLRSLCAEVHPDDGTDPRLDPRSSLKAGRTRHKALQLCRQVAEALDALLAGQTGDALLNDLAIVEVIPAPDASRLLATVTVRESDRPVDPAPILAGLDRASGWLRSEVAASITRKRAPLLAFRLVQVTPDGWLD